jgi:hypothetical protein
VIGGLTRINAIAKQVMPTISVMALTCKKDNNAFTVLLITSGIRQNDPPH